jgi:alkaline phosphatase
MNLKVDVIGTDHVSELVSFTKSLPQNTFHNQIPHTVYQPQYKYASVAPKNIILMIGDGMGLTQLYSGYTANRGGLSIFNIKSIGFSVTTALDSYITDSAAGATAMSTGKKTNNRFIGVDSLGNTLPLITEKLKAKGFKTAIISSGDITDATPASFYAHQSERSLNEDIANDFLKSNTDILIGGGLKAFKERADNRNLLQILKESGYSVFEDFTALETIKGDKFVIIDDSAVVSKMKGRKDFLPRSIERVTSLLAKSDKPFFLMAEGAKVDVGGHENNVAYVVTEVLDFDQAVGEAMKFVDQNGETLLIITADHETGGLSLLGGNISAGDVVGNFSTNDHTAVMVPVFSYGPGAENFQGVYQNTDINSKLLELLKVY